MRGEHKETPAPVTASLRIFLECHCGSAAADAEGVVLPFPDSLPTFECTLQVGEKARFASKNNQCSNLRPLRLAMGRLGSAVQSLAANLKAPRLHNSTQDAGCDHRVALHLSASDQAHQSAEVHDHEGQANAARAHWQIELERRPIQAHCQCHWQELCQTLGSQLRGVRGPVPDGLGATVANWGF
jgi:hypothetical protein